MSRILSALMGGIPPQDMTNRADAAGPTSSRAVSRLVADGVDRGLGRALDDLLSGASQDTPATRTGQRPGAEPPPPPPPPPTYVRTGQRPTSES